MSTLWCQNDLHTDNAFMISLHRLLLSNSDEKQSPLCGRSNASRLPHLFRGNILEISDFSSSLTNSQFVELLELTKCNKFGDYSICLNLWMMSLFCPVDIQYIRAAWMKWGNISSEYHSSCLLSSICLKSYCSIWADFGFDSASGMHALSARSQFVTCQWFGRSLTWRLLLHQCLKHIETKWSVSLFLLFLSCNKVLMIINYATIYLVLDLLMLCCD